MVACDLNSGGSVRSNSHDPAGRKKKLFWSNSAEKFVTFCAENYSNFLRLEEAIFIRKKILSKQHLQNET